VPPAVGRASRIARACRGRAARRAFDARHALAEAIKKELESASAPGAVLAIDSGRALLAEALGVVYDNRDNGFATLMTWHNKSVWLVFCGLFFIVALASALPNAVLFLVGATGGLLSRLSRTVYGADIPPTTALHGPRYS